MVGLLCMKQFRLLTFPIGDGKLHTDSTCLKLNIYLICLHIKILKKEKIAYTTIFLNLVFLRTLWAVIYLRFHCFSIWAIRGVEARCLSVARRS